MRDRRKIVILLGVLCAFLLTGCGKKKIDVMENLTVKFDGYNGHGTVELENAYAWENEAFEIAGIESVDDLQILTEALLIEGAVSYEVIPDEGLSNGDVVTVKATINENVAENYDFKLVAPSEKVFTVENLPEIETVDLFQNVDISYHGIAPYVTAELVDASADSYIGFKKFVLDKTDNLCTGDIITVTAEVDEEEMTNAGYIAEQTTKEFIVPELDKYVEMLDEIPEETISKMNKQFEDAISAQVANLWVEKESLVDANYVGCYMLKAKEDTTVSDYNLFYSVYKIDVKNSENEFSYYTYCRFKNIILLKDGTCSVDISDYTMPTGAGLFGRVSGEAFRKGKYYYLGYEDIDSLFNNCVTKNIEFYEYESMITEG